MADDDVIDQTMNDIRKQMDMANEISNAISANQAELEEEGELRELGELYPI